MASLRMAPVLGALLGAAALDACVLTAPDIGAPLRKLRAEQEVQVDRIAEAFCETYYGCGCEQTSPAHDTEVDCVAHIREGLLGRLEQGINDHLDYDHACLDAVAEMVEAIGCTTPDEQGFDASLVALIRAAERCRTYSGELQFGEDCERLHSARGDECEPGLYCSTFLMCTEDIRLAEGEPCIDNPSACDDGLVCDWSAEASTLTCVGPVPVGGSCAQLGYCEIDSWCVPETLTCQSLPRANEPCIVGFGAGLCAAGHRCIAGTCDLAGDFGEPCTNGCQLGLECDDTGRCAEQRALICDLEASLP